jgi:hypothetical protein
MMTREMIQGNDAGDDKMTTHMTEDEAILVMLDHPTAPSEEAHAVYAALGLDDWPGDVHGAWEACRQRVDALICQAVADADQAADSLGDNWADHLPDYFRCEDRYSTDSWYVGTLPDGRTVWLQREDQAGAARYGIVDAEEEEDEEEDEDEAEDEDDDEDDALV